MRLVHKITALDILDFVPFDMDSERGVEGGGKLIEGQETVAPVNDV